jgi:hypothetical protein
MKTDVYGFLSVRSTRLNSDKVKLRSPAEGVRINRIERGFPFAAPQYRKLYTEHTIVKKEHCRLSEVDMTCRYKKFPKLVPLLLSGE